MFRNLSIALFASQHFCDSCLACLSCSTQGQRIDFEIEGDEGGGGGGAQDTFSY